MAKLPAEPDIDTLKKAATKAAKSLTDIVKVVERASDLDSSAVDAVFQNISHLLLTAHQKARLSLALAIASNGAGDLTKELKGAPPVGLPALEPRERVVGERKSKASNFDEADVDFIDD